MSNERRLIVFLGGLCAIASGLSPLLRLRHVPAWLLIGTMLGIVGAQVVLMVRMRLRGDCACPPLRQRLGF